MNLLGLLAGVSLFSFGLGYLIGFVDRNKISRCWEISAGEWKDMYYKLKSKGE